MGLTDQARRVWSALRDDMPPALAPPDTYDKAEVAAMLRALGVALVEVVQPTNLVGKRLLKVARRYTTCDVRVVVLPTILLIQIDTVGYEIDVTTRPTTQLDLAGRVDHIARLAVAGAIAPADAIRELAAARAMPNRFHPVLTVLGYVITTLGFGMIINPTLGSLWGHAFLGLVVGLIVLAPRLFPSLNAILPTVAAFAVTVLATWFVADAANIGVVRVIAPALVAVLPGLALTVAAMELADTEIIAGSSRLIYGVVQLMLMVFGVALGMAVAGQVPTQPPDPSLGSWSFYVAIGVIGVGLFIYLSAPRGSLLWLTLAVAVALLGQKFGEQFVSSAHAGAIGAALVLPFTLLAAQLKTAPTAMVMILAAFWALVPGALSFESLSAAAAGGGPTAFTAMITAVGAVFSIALGTLMSWSVITAISSRRVDR
ncbi:threonine/serine exporter ThrE family protein [Mycolicibacterium sp. CR10]|uniref:threonine/serine ThrE exporter family protein n=1 Tax=Mycolicibacterium sp. CR10 TaxID=2562314 RepID=UPI0010C0A436|nr:threonine/serine exporter family protein [Mycolicibacterium sp. CR10]